MAFKSHDATAANRSTQCQRKRGKSTTQFCSIYHHQTKRKNRIHNTTKKEFACHRKCASKSKRNIPAVTQPARPSIVPKILLLREDSAPDLPQVLLDFQHHRGEVHFSLYLVPTQSHRHTKQSTNIRTRLSSAVTASGNFLEPTSRRSGKKWINSASDGTLKMMLRYLEAKESLESRHKRRGGAYLLGAESRRGSHFLFRLIRLARLPSRDREAGGCFGIWAMCLTRRRGLESSKLPLGGNTGLGEL